MLDILDCLILRDVEQVGYGTVLKLNDRFSSIKEIWNSSQSELESIIGKSAAVNNLLKLKNVNRRDFAVSFNSTRDKGIQMYCIFDEEYPAALRELKDPPLIIYVKGEIPRDINNNIAIVGARNTTYHGNKLARDCGKALAGCGYTVISGLARGTDTAAHLGALDGGGRTIAILGGGIDGVFPPENDELAKDILHNRGALISEFPPGTRYQDFRLGKRNRLISCLSKAVIATEVKERSETSIAIRHAIQLGRQIFVIPALRDSSANYTDYQKDLVYLGAVNILDPSDMLDNLQADRGHIKASDYFEFMSNDFKLNYDRIPEKDRLNKIIDDQITANQIVDSQIVGNQNPVIDNRNEVQISYPDRGVIEEIAGVDSQRRYEQNLDNKQSVIIEKEFGKYLEKDAQKALDTSAGIHKEIEDNYDDTKVKKKRRIRKKHLEDGSLINLSAYLQAE